MSATTWQYWFPDRGEGRDDAREGPRLERVPSTHEVAKCVAEKQWHADSPDYWDSITVCLTRGHNGETVYTAEVEVEHCPHFRTSSVKESGE